MMRSQQEEPSLNQHDDDASSESDVYKSPWMLAMESARCRGHLSSMLSSQLNEDLNSPTFQRDDPSLMQTSSPSSSRMTLRVVWVAGCWGPKLRFNVLVFFDIIFLFVLLYILCLPKDFHSQNFYNFVLI